MAAVVQVRCGEAERIDPGRGRVDPSRPLGPDTAGQADFCVGEFKGYFVFGLPHIGPVGWP
jgi:hypothetical protein